MQTERIDLGKTSTGKDLYCYTELDDTEFRLCIPLDFELEEMWQIKQLLFDKGYIKTWSQAGKMSTVVLIQTFDAAEWGYPPASKNSTNP